MTEIDATLQVIAIALFLLLLFKDMSGQDQLLSRLCPDLQGGRA